MTPQARFLKRLFDVVAAAVGLLVLSPLLMLGWLAATISTGRNGFYVQTRVGYRGQLFPLVKLRSMRVIEGMTSTVTSDDDIRVTRVGWWLRKLKLDELPQLFNVLLGQMSLVGPRPDVPGFADRLTGDDLIILTVRPGVTGPASLVFRNEEKLLAAAEDPETYNREVIWPEKVRLNRQYVKNYSFWLDIKYILLTIAGRS